MLRFGKWLIVVCMLVLATGASVMAQDAEARPYRIVVVTHGQASDPFWSVVKNGVDQAAADLGITVNYHAPETFDMVAMAQLIDTAVAAEPDGIVISNPDPTALGDAIQGAVDAGIPVVSINSGVDDYADLGILTHVGQTEVIAGEGAGQRMAEAGVTNALCVNQEVGNAALDQRCDGFAQGLGDVPSTVVGVDLADPTGAENAITAVLSDDPTIDGILTLGPTGAAPALAALEGNDAVMLATFDLSPEVLSAIEDG